MSNLKYLSICILADISDRDLQDVLNQKAYIR